MEEAFLGTKLRKLNRFSLNKGGEYMKLPSQDSSTGRGLKTAAQSIIGFIIGLFVVVWAVPGVPTTVINYVHNNFLQVLLIIGIPSGITSFVWNFFRKDIPNY